MKFKKIVSAFIGTAICLSVLTVNAMADEAGYQNKQNQAFLSSETLTESKCIENKFNNNYPLDNTENIEISMDQLFCISQDTYGIAMCSDSAPVAGLAYMVANSESLVNGKVTTDTIIYWLWNDGSTDYTYDLDGDEITSHVVGGIYDYIIGNVTLNDEVVGFATKITEAGPHELTYYVTDSNGNKSNTVNISFTVEPADGNQRPVGVLYVANKDDYYTNTDIAFNWSDSYDEDDGDYISAIRMRVYFNGEYELVTSDSKYYVSADDYGIVLNFDKEGTYTISISVSDNHNAWSDWVGGEITVTEKQVVILTLADTDWSDSKYVRWKETGSNSYMYHTYYSRLGGDICVVYSEAKTYSSYTNHNGTYYNVSIAPIAAGTLFSCAETWSSATGNPNNYTDPIFGLQTPRRITQEEIDYIDGMKKANYIVYNPTTLEVIDFYSVLNPILSKMGSSVEMIK